MKNGGKFNGYIEIGDIVFNFSIDEHLCLIFPPYPFTDNGYSNPLPDKIKEIAGLGSLKGIDGIEPQNFSPLFVDFITENNMTAKLLVTKTPGLRYRLADAMSSYQFYAPIIIMSKFGANHSLDLSFFDAITFSGESVNLTHNPKYAVKPTDYMKDSPGAIDIKIKPHKQYSKDFDVVVAGVKAKLTYSIANNNEHWNLQNNSLGALNSFVRISFDEKQTLEMVEKCYLHFLRFVQFLLGRQNVGFEVKLQQKGKNMPLGFPKPVDEKGLELFSNVAEVFVNDSYEDYCDVRIDHTIQLGHLKDDLPKLFNLFSENEKIPFLLMLPAANDRARQINYTDVGDLCTSLEIEYNLKNYKAPKDDIRDSLISELKETVTAFQEDAMTSDTELFNSAFGSINNINLPLKERIIYLWEKSLDEVIDGGKTESIKKDIAGFVRVRNLITHNGKIEWAENHIIYIRLLRTLYYSILIRAGFSDIDSKSIARQKFQHDGMLF